MTLDILRFEWRYHTRQVSFVAAATLFFLFGVALTATGFGPDNIHINSPYSITESIGLLSLAAVFILAVFCANAVVRDRETQMEEIVFTTSVEKLPFLVGRFTGSFLAAFTAFSTCALGMIVASQLPFQDADRIGSVTVLAYLWALVVIALPNLLFAGVLLFALSTGTRSVLASYAGSVLLYVLYFVTAAMTNSPLMASSVPGAGSAQLGALLDPFALSAFFEQTQHWLPAERNTRLISLSGTLLLNRLLWTGASIAVFAFVYFVFSFRVTRNPEKSRTKSAKPEITPLTTYAPVQTRTSQWKSYVAATKTEIRTFLLTLPFGAMLLFWAALAMFEMVSDLRGGEYGAASYPAASLLFGSLQTPLTLLGTILLIYTSAEMIWRERTLRFSGILHATPASNAVFVASKCTALSALVAALTLTALAGAAILQLIGGWPIPFGAMLAFGCMLAAPLILFACAAVFIQTLSPHKYLGMLIVVLLAVVCLQGSLLGIHDRLLRFASMPPLTYSAFNGFGDPTAFLFYALHWSALAALLLLIATAAWRQTRARIARLPAIALTMVFAATGAYVFYNTHVLDARERGDDLLDWRADYERIYKPFASQPQARVTEMRANVDLYPETASYHVRGTYTVHNPSPQPVRRILVAVRRDAAAATITVPHARLEHDARFNQYQFTLQTPLQPGATTTVAFDIHYANRGFRDGADPSILSNGTYLMTHRSFPSLGYRVGYELENPRERRKRGLPVVNDPNASTELPQHDALDAADWVQCDVTISTSADQRAVAPGNLVREWEEGNRRFARFRTERPIPHQYTIASARYAVARETHDGITIEIYHHPTHSQNVARMMRAAVDTLRYCRENFSPYPHKTLRLAEISAQFQEFSGFAQPGVVFFGENRGFLVDASDPRRIDLVYRRTAHEVAHQWFGYTLLAADAPGDSMLTESLTKYTELMVLRNAYGNEAVGQLLTYELDRYLAGRTEEQQTEPPLARVDNQPYLYYRKGAIVFHGIEDRIGEPRLNLALRNLIAEQGGPGHKPLAADLLRHLRAVTPPADFALIDEWLNGVVLYDLRMDDAKVRRLSDGKFEVTLRVHAAKDAHPLRESIDIALFDAGDAPVYLGKHALRDGEQDIVVIVAKEPLSAAVDPYITRIDRNRFDNTKRIE